MIAFDNGPSQGQSNLIEEWRPEPEQTELKQVGREELESGHRQFSKNSLQRKPQDWAVAREGNGIM